MSLQFEITLRSGKEAQGRLRWPAKKLDSAATSGPHGLGTLPLGLYSIPRGTLSDRTGEPPYCDSLLNCWFQSIQPQFSTSHTDLGIHPNSKVAGTEGRIGLLGADTKAWRQAFQDLRADEKLEVVEAHGLRAASPSLAATTSTLALGPWPSDSQNALETYYGKHALDAATGKPTTAWEKDHLTRLTLPYRMSLSWQVRTKVSRITCHQSVAASLGRVLAGILKHYGSEQEVQNHNMHMLGGCYLYRAVTSGSRLSTHAWGAGIDLDPVRNRFKKPWDPREGMMPLEVVALFESEGWRWGGRFTRPDAMHFQATS
jgi:hypothetical protein